MAFVASALAGSMFGAIYAYVILYLPFAGWITFLIAAAFAVATGAVTAYTLKKQKTRNISVALLVSLVVSVISYYVSWGIWVYAFLRRNDVAVQLDTILSNPAALWTAVQAINETGAWTVRSWTPTGGMLWTLWAVEAGIVILGAMFMVLGMMLGEVFCERCSLWCKLEEEVCRVSASGVSTAKEWAEAKDFDRLANLGPPATADAEWLRFDLYACPRCRMTNTLTMKRVAVTTDKDGDKSTDEAEILEKLLISGSEAATIREFSKRFAAEKKDPLRNPLSLPSE